ncbi:cysteine-rich receptor-like protein kinase 43 [Lycium ferocissimum]|uniref:cysteine-rich receptor-like protein kinase 43 n=1 Tax=Lycium ferocissimum TaxID=112874 RepID=UPI002815106E|nr:cysteine-rich receptor-like protein kinase 43 [Lycium ferocissimum]
MASGEVGASDVAAWSAPGSGLVSVGASVPGVDCPLCFASIFKDGPDLLGLCRGTSSEEASPEMSIYSIDLRGVAKRISSPPACRVGAEGPSSAIQIEDVDMNPAISDFGTARSFGGNEIGAMTTRVARTYGYMSLEYAAEGKFSVKSDVFSFGVLVMEIVSGKRNRGFLCGSASKKEGFWK